MTTFDYIQQQRVHHSSTKHEQIVNGVVNAIREGVLKNNSTLPSVNHAVKEIGVARKTIVKAYDELKQRGIIESRNRLGYFVINEKVPQQERVFLLLNAFNMYQEVLYTSMMNEVVGCNIRIDVFFHHTNPEVFINLLHSNKGRYSKYIISPFRNNEVEEYLKGYNFKNTLVIARDSYLQQAQNYVVQNFQENLYAALKEAYPDLKKYSRVALVFDPDKKHPEEIPDTVKRFCEQHHMNFIMMPKVERKEIVQGGCFFVIDDSQMLRIIELAEEKDLKPGSSTGILSYNDTPMKRFIKNGISVVSTDFKTMGKHAAEWILGNDTRVVLPTSYIKRGSTR